MALDLQFLAPFAAAGAGALATRLAVRGWIGPIDTVAGWAVVRPSVMHWGGVVGAGGIIGMLAYVGLFIGSARTDAEFQMRMLWLIVAGFTINAAVCIWQMRQIAAAAVRWRGSQLSFCRKADGARITQAMTDVIAMHRPPFGAVRIRFADGNVLKLDPYADKVPDLWNRIVEVNDG